METLAWNGNSLWWKGKELLWTETPCVLCPKEATSSFSFSLPLRPLRNVITLPCIHILQKTKGNQFSGLCHYLRFKKFYFYFRIEVSKSNCSLSFVS